MGARLAEHRSCRGRLNREARIVIGTTTTTHRSSLTIRAARPGDVDGIALPLAANAPERGGLLTGSFSRARIECWVADAMPVVVAQRDGSFAGVLVTASRERARVAPVVAAMLEVYPGRADAYVYGPVCISQVERGHGVLPALYAEVQRLLPSREALLFISQDNIASLKVHTKLGMRRVGSFRFDGVGFAILSSLGPNERCNRDEQGFGASRDHRGSSRACPSGPRFFRNGRSWRSLTVAPSTAFRLAQEQGPRSLSAIAMRWPAAERRGWERSDVRGGQPCPPQSRSTTLLRASRGTKVVSLARSVPFGRRGLGHSCPTSD